jgi:nicotinamidase-related amidase
MSSSRSETCLLIIDMINPFTFPDAEELLPAAFQAATRIAQLKDRATMAGIPTIYVNDNFGKWQHDFRYLVAHCLQTSGNRRSIVEVLHPHEEDYFILKPKHSAFFATPLELLLRSLEARRLILTGIAGNNCVHYTAADAYMRDFILCVPEDCTASLDASSNQLALEHMKSTFKVDTRPSPSLHFSQASQP